MPGRPRPPITTTIPATRHLEAINHFVGRLHPLASTVNMRRHSTTTTTTRRHYITMALDYLAAQQRRQQQQQQRPITILNNNSSSNMVATIMADLLVVLLGPQVKFRGPHYWVGPLE